MSEENVGIVRGVYSEFQDGNFSLPASLDPNIRIIWLDVVGGETETVGVQAMGKVMGIWADVYERLTLTAERLIDAADQVVASSLARTGKTSGAGTEWRHGAVWTLRDGRVISVVAYSEPSDARQAAGLSE